MALASTTLNALECLVFDPPGLRSAPELVVVLCHGFGVPGDDLAPLGQELVSCAPALGSKARFLFPSAPISLSDAGFPYRDARAWWPLEVDRFGIGEDPAGLHEERPESMARACDLLLGLLDRICVDTPIPMSRIVLAGFSQGAMLATDVALRLGESPAALVVLSGRVVCANDWISRAPVRAGLQVLISHGRHDPLLAFEGAEHLRDLLVRAGLDVEFVPFDGPHTIAGEALERVAALLLEL